MYYVPGFTNYLNSIGERPVYSDPTAEVPIVNVLDPAYQAMYSEPDYSTPTSQPVYAEPVYTPPPPPPPPPVYTPPTPQPVYSEPVYSEPVYTPPTAQPVYSEPVYSEPTPRGILSDPAFAERFSAMAPMQPEPSVPTVDLGGWNLEDFQKQFAPTGPSNADAVNAWLAEQAAQGREYVYDPNSQDLGYQIAMNSAVPMMSRPSFANFDPNNPLASMGEVFRFDIGDNKATAPVVLGQGQNYVLTDAKGENVLGRASTPEEMRALMEAANAQKYGWNLYRGDEKGEFTSGAQLFGEADPRVGGVLGALINYGLPIGVGLLTGGIGALPSLGAGTTAGIMGATGLVSGVLGGKSFGDALLQGALSAGTAGLLKGTDLGKAIGGALDKVPVVGDALRELDKLALSAPANAAANAAANEIVVTAARNALLPGLAAGAVGGGLANAFTPQVITNPVTGEMSLQRPSPPEVPQEPTGGLADAESILVTGSRVPPPNFMTAPISGALGDALSIASPGPVNYGDKVYEQPQQEEPGTTVVGQRPLDVPFIPPPSFTSAPPTGVPETIAAPEDEIVVSNRDRPIVPPPLFTSTPPAGALDTVAAPEDEIVVSKRNEPVVPPSIVASTIANLAPSLNAPTTPTPEAAPATEPKKNTVNDILDYIQLGSLALGGLGSLFGGGDKAKTGGALPGGWSGLSPVFGAQLPGANLPGLTGGTGGPRTAADLGSQGLRSMQDYYRYGYGPEQSFFSRVPQGAPNTSQAYTGYAEGGFAVKGAGDGREDKIPALLSDGEYVIDAETVALLGNGSNKAGADMLDQFRVNVRKHKGRDLARGEFSKNAKRPERYLAGGRT